MKTRQQYLEQYAEKIAEYEGLIAMAQRHYDRQEWDAGHVYGHKADMLLDYEIADPIHAEHEREGISVGTSDFFAYIKRNALIKALSPDVPYMLQPETAKEADIWTDGKLDPQKISALFSGTKRRE